MTRTSSIAYPSPVNHESGDTNPRTQCEVRHLVQSVEHVAALGVPFDGALDPLLSALTTVDRAADSLRQAP
jgi:hypothetical protein